MNTSWLFGGVDMDRWIDFKTGQPDKHAAFMARGRAECGLFDRPFVSWCQDIALFMGPRQTGYLALDVDDLTAVELRSHRAMGAHLGFYRAHAPGFERAYPMLSAPQIGVRHVACDKNSHGFMREIPQCWITGQAAGTAAALAVKQGVRVRAVDIAAPQADLLGQGVFLCRAESRQGVVA